jgi:hypothetical protein
MKGHNKAYLPISDFSESIRKILSFFFKNETEKRRKDATLAAINLGDFLELIRKEVGYKKTYGKTKVLAVEEVEHSKLKRKGAKNVRKNT